MIVKGIIKEKIDNKFRVRIPLFESAGNPQEVVLLATLSYQPGNLDSYDLGDVVFVGFENGEFSNVVILGKLFLGNETKTNSSTYNANLKITETAELPKQTKIGDLKPNEVYAALKNSSIHEERLTQNEKDIKALTTLINDETYGGRVVGKVENVSEMPSVQQYKSTNPDWSYGDGYLVGTETPYDLYVLLRRDSDHTSDYWYNAGKFPNPGKDAGFGEITAEATTLASDAQATVNVTVSGTSEALNLDFQFGIPKGAEVIFKTETFNNPNLDVSFENFTDKKIINNVETVNVNFIIPSNASQGWAGSATIKLDTPPTFTLTNNTNYDVYYILEGYQATLNEWQSKLLNGITLELMSECNGFDVRIYGKQTKDY